MFRVTSDEIVTEISKLKNGKAAGPFSIPVDILKILKFAISEPLAILFNTSFETEIVPTSFKISNVIPVYKKDPPSSLCNHRPISLLSIFNKLLEKLMCYRLLDLLKKKNVFYANQFGFRRNYSTEYAILKITDKKIQRAIDEYDYSLRILSDFIKAFDTVNHEILIPEPTARSAVRGY